MVEMEEGEELGWAFVDKEEEGRGGDEDAKKKEKNVRRTRRIRRVGKERKEVSLALVCVRACVHVGACLCVYDYGEGEGKVSLSLLARFPHTTTQRERERPCPPRQMINRLTHSPGT